MVSIKASLRLFFTFYFSNFSLPHRLEEYKSLKDNLKKYEEDNLSITVHFGENWEEAPSTRKFLLASNPHLHYQKIIKIKDFSFLNDFLTNNTKITLNISIVQGGSGGAELEIENLKITDSKKTSFLKAIKSLQEETIDNNIKDFNTLFSLNKFFIKEINDFKGILKKTNELESVDWNEFFLKSKDGKTVANYLIAIQKNKDGYEYADIDPNTSNDYYYQQPYLVLFFPYLQDRKKRVEVITDYFGGMPLFLSERCFKKVADIESLEKKISEKGICKLVIKNKKEKDIAEIYMDPIKTIVLTKQVDKLHIKEIKPIIHRGLFFARTIMHYCILWDARLQNKFQQIYEILRDVNTQESDVDQLIKCLEKLNHIQFNLAKDEAELYNSFIWRYSSSLPSKLGYLSITYNLMDDLFDLQNKVKNLRNSMTDLRDMLSFSSNIIRGFIAPRFSETLRKISLKGKKEI